jgi:nickel-type superoxide dismutase maturation protease
VGRVLKAVLAAWGAVWLVNRSLVRVEGRSMLPTLAPGDLVVTLPALLPGVVRPGRVVVCRDPRSPERVILKRVVAIEDGRLTLRGDNDAESTDSRVFGLVDRSDVRRVVVGQVLGRSHGAGALGGGFG